MLQLLAASMLLLSSSDTIPERASTNDSLATRTSTSVANVVALEPNTEKSTFVRAANRDNALVLRSLSLTVPQPAALTALQDTNPRRRAIVYSDWYGRRLTVHRIGSYTMLPLFVGQFLLGSELLKQKKGTFDGTRLVPINDDLRTAHKYTAAAVGTLFAVNGITGLWNLYESRKDPAHRKLRYAHALLMAGSEAGFVITGIAAKNAVNKRVINAERHRNYALGSMALATTGVSLMWFSNRD